MAVKWNFDRIKNVVAKTGGSRSGYARRTVEKALKAAGIVAYRYCYDGQERPIILVARKYRETVDRVLRALHEQGVPC